MGCFSQAKQHLRTIVDAVALTTVTHHAQQLNVRPAMPTTFRQWHNMIDRRIAQSSRVVVSSYLNFAFTRKKDA